MRGFVVMTVILSVFAERLSELMFYRNLSAAAFAGASGIPLSSIHKYLRGEKFPSYRAALEIVGFFDCSLDFLFGRTETQEVCSFAACPPFSERIRTLCGHYGISFYKLSKDAGIPQSKLFDWSAGRHLPSVESLAQLADFFDCSMDFVVGRIS